MWPALSALQGSYPASAGLRTTHQSDEGVASDRTCRNKKRELGDCWLGPIEWSSGCLSGPRAAGMEDESVAESTHGQTYKLDSAGLARLFGDLEARIMDVLWGLGGGTVPDVMAALDGGAQYTTIQTVMNRLADKRVLTRALLAPGGAYLYRPTEPRDAFVIRVSRRLVGSLLSEFGDAALVGLVDAVDDLAPEQLAALEQRIRVLRETEQ